MEFDFKAILQTFMAECEEHFAKMEEALVALETKPHERQHHLGTKNVEVARHLLESESIPLVGHDVGGQRGRKLIFQTDDGAAWIKPL